MNMTFSSKSNSNVGESFLGKRNVWGSHNMKSNEPGLFSGKVNCVGIGLYVYHTGVFNNGSLHILSICYADHWRQDALMPHRSPSQCCSVPSNKQTLAKLLSYKRKLNCKGIFICYII